MRVFSLMLSFMLVGAGLFSGLAVGGPAPVQAASGESRILSVTYLANPSVVDVTVTGISFDMATGTITVTGTVRCDANFPLVLLDINATQRQAGGYSLSSAPSCDSDGSAFTKPVTAIDGSFRPGRVTVVINALACSFNCGEEVVLVEAVLIPDHGR